MSISSLDDVVEHWMLDASAFVTRLSDGRRSVGLYLASLRQTMVFVSFIAISSLFAPLFMFAIALVFLTLLGGAIWLNHLAQGDQA